MNILKRIVILLFVVFSHTCSAQSPEFYNVVGYRLDSLGHVLGVLKQAHEKRVAYNGIRFDSTEVIFIISPFLTEAHGLSKSVLDTIYRRMGAIDTIVTSGLYATIISLPKSDNHLKLHIRNMNSNVWIFEEGERRYWILSPFDLFPKRQMMEFEFQRTEFRPFYDSDILGRTEYYLFQDRILEIMELNK